MPLADNPSPDQHAIHDAPKKTRIRIDWTRGARLLGSGVSPEAVAAALGVEEERLWRHLKASRRFKRLLAETLDLQSFTAGLQALRPAGERVDAE